METLETLSDALETTADIQSIVRTMKALSSVSIRQYEHAEAAMAGYARTVDLGLMAAIRDPVWAGRPLQTGGGAGAHGAMIVIGSDRGLCGGYNDRITRSAGPHLADGKVRLGVVGARIAARLDARGRTPDFALTLPASVEGLAPLVQRLILEIDRWTQDRHVGTVHLLHNRREGPVTAAPQRHQLLPLPETDLQALAASPWPGRSLPLVRMAPDRLMSWLIQQRIFVVIYRALAEALASEHASRLAAMQAAERNIEERRDALRRLHRQRRQEAITRELMDVVSGFEASGDPPPPT
jgi:F-type H+-transporting ATPase subunit gamma